MLCPRNMKLSKTLLDFLPYCLLRDLLMKLLSLLRLLANTRHPRKDTVSPHLRVPSSFFTSAERERERCSCGGNIPFCGLLYSFLPLRSPPPAAAFQSLPICTSQPANRKDQRTMSCFLTHCSNREDHSTNDRNHRLVSVLQALVLVHIQPLPSSLL